MNKKDWKEKVKEFEAMKVKASENLAIVQKQLEELDVFLAASQAQIKTFK